MKHHILKSSRMLVLLGVSVGLGAGRPPSWDELIIAGRDVFAGRVKARSSDGTNSNPPQVKLEVKEVFQGKLGQQSLDVIWIPCSIPSDTMSPEKAKIWGKTECPGPKVGEDFLVIGRQDKSKYRIDRAITPTQENKDWLIYTIAHKKAPVYKQQNIPGTNFVNHYLEEVQGSGKQPTHGSRVTVKLSGIVLKTKEEQKNRSFSFILGDASIGKGLETAIGAMRVGGKSRVRIREEMSGGIKSFWSDIPAGAQLELEIELLNVE